MRSRQAWIAPLLLLAAWAAPAVSQVCNLKVLTDAGPDYSDMDSMVRSITGRWDKPADKCWAMYYWNHLARRQTTPMNLHGLDLTDPIRQFNDYGFTMCSTISGINCSIWDHMGLRAKYWDISLHTVSEVEYDGAYHLYDNSLSALYTTCDGRRLAGVQEIGAEGACEASAGRREPGHIAKYHCLYGTSPNGFLQGADTPRSLAEEYRCFNPNGLKYRSYFYDWDRGHRYVLNLRAGESYTRLYVRPDGGERPRASGKDYQCDRRYYVPNTAKRVDPESVNPRYGIRGNGVWSFRPPLTADRYDAKYFHSQSNIAPALAGGLQPAKAGQPAWVIFKVQAANVVTSQQIKARFALAGQAAARIAVSTTNGLQWQEVWTSHKPGQADADVPLIDPVNGAYEVLVRVELTGAAQPADTVLHSLDIQTVTQINSKTQPRLNVGRNEVYVAAGEQTDAIVFWPELQAGRYKPLAVEESNLKSDDRHEGYTAVLYQDKGGQDAHVVFRMDAPADLTGLTYGGRMYPRHPGSSIEFLHSLDGGKTWTTSHRQEAGPAPWDVIKYVTVDNLPPGTRSVLFKYRLSSKQAGRMACGLYAVRMEGRHKVPDGGFKPMEVTYAWKERQEDYSLVARRHTEIVTQVPHKYVINVAGCDHPEMESLTLRVLAGPEDKPQPGYSDGKDAGGTRYLYTWETLGKNLAQGRPYTVTVPSRTNWGAGDPEGRKLTDGVVGPTYAGGIVPGFGLLWEKGQAPEITVDLGEVQACGAFRIHLAAGWPWWDALKGQIQDQVEVLTSPDGKQYASQGLFDFRLRKKDVPVNFMLPDDETAQGWNFRLIPPAPVQARYVKYRITPQRALVVTEVQVLDHIRLEPFDLKLNNGLLVQ